MRFILILSLILNLYKPAFLDDPDWIWDHGTPMQKAELGLDYISWRLEYDLSSSELELFARVVEMESNRQYGMTEGKIAIAVCIWDRVMSSSFPNTVNGVLTESGQFSTVQNGWCYLNYTQGSLAAIIEAWDRIVYAEAPTNLLYFNCVNYCHTPFDIIGGNYFSTTGDAEYIEW